MSDTLAEVLKSDLNFDAIPAHLRPILERCLRRDPQQRWRCMGDVRVALEDSGHLPDAPQKAKPRAAALRWTGGIVGGVLLAIGSFVLGTVSRRQQAKLAEPPLIQFDTELRSQGRFGREIGTNVILSPDGTRIVFVSTGPMPRRD